MVSASSEADYLGASGGGTFAGQQAFQIFTLEDAVAENIESLEIHVQIVGRPETHVVLEADILDDDITISPNQVAYTYDVFNQLVRRTQDVYGENGPEPIDLSATRRLPLALNTAVMIRSCQPLLQFSR